MCSAGRHTYVRNRVAVMRTRRANFSQIMMRHHLRNGTCRYMYIAAWSNAVLSKCRLYLDKRATIISWLPKMNEECHERKCMRVQSVQESCWREWVGVAVECVEYMCENNNNRRATYRYQTCCLGEYVCTSKNIQETDSRIRNWILFSF